MGDSKTFRIAIRAFGPFETAIRREWASFQKESGCKLELEPVSLDHHPLYQALFEKGGLKSGDWDIAFINTDWLAEAHQSGALVDLAPYLKKNPPEDYPKGWTPSLLRLQQFGDQVLGLPYHDGPECLIYRKDVFADAELQGAYRIKFHKKLEVPDTWDEFIRVAEFLNRPQVGQSGTVFAAYPDGHNTVYDICLQLWSRGGELFDNSGRPQLNTPPMIESLRFYRAALNNRSAIHPKSREFDSVKSGAAFARGEVVMMVNWFGFAANAETAADSQVKGKVGVAPVPRGKGGKSVSLNSYWLLAVPAGSPNREVAYRFARHCLSRQADRQRTLDGVIGCRKTTWTDTEVNRVIPFYGEMEKLHAHARELPRLTNWVELSAVIDRMVLEAINTNRPIEAIAAEAQKKAAALENNKSPSPRPADPRRGDPGVPRRGPG
jgi:multiple sugar transport system substrate-binding protein